MFLITIVFQELLDKIVEKHNLSLFYLKTAGLFERSINKICCDP